MSIHKSDDTTALTEHDSKINNIKFILLILKELCKRQRLLWFLLRREL